LSERMAVRRYLGHPAWSMISFKRGIGILDLHAACPCGGVAGICGGDIRLAVPATGHAMWKDMRPKCRAAACIPSLLFTRRTGRSPQPDASLKESTAVVDNLLPVAIYTAQSSPPARQNLHGASRSFRHLLRIPLEGVL
jgi:hypothetical protein